MKKEYTKALMEEKLMEVIEIRTYPNGVMAKLHNRRIAVIKMNDGGVCIRFQKYDPAGAVNINETLGRGYVGQTSKLRGIITTAVFLTPDAGEALAEVFAVFNLHMSLPKEP